jgi:hypothetical protein
MNKRELEFRKWLTRAMAGVWFPTIHVENHLNPGVPDLSFVMKPLPARTFETGWLELKAMELSKTLKITVEPGQHSWMEAHASLIPAYFLIEVSGKLYLVHGSRHGILLDPITPAALADISVIVAHQSDTSALAAALRDVTRRS